jgi:hypothetical protein
MVKKNTSFLLCITNKMLLSLVFLYILPPVQIGKKKNQWTWTSYSGAKCGDHLLGKSPGSPVKWDINTGSIFFTGLL